MASLIATLTPVMSEWVAGAPHDLQNKALRLFVDGGELIADVGDPAEFLGNSNHAYIMSVSVDHECRRRGFATHLFRALFNTCSSVTPGIIITPAAEAFAGMLRREAAFAGVELGHMRLDPQPERLGA